MAVPFADGTHPDAPGVVKFDDEGIQIRLDLPMTPARVELSLNAGLEHHLSWRRSGREVAQLVVPPLPNQGLQRVQIPVPQPVQEGGIDRLDIKAGANGGYLGHALISPATNRAD